MAWNNHKQCMFNRKSTLCLINSIHTEFRSHCDSRQFPIFFFLPLAGSCCTFLSRMNCCFEGKVSHLSHTYCYWIEGNKNGFSFLLGEEAIAKVTTVSWKRNQSSIWPDFTLQRLISTLIFGYFEATFCVITKKKLPTINRLFFGSKANFLHKGGSFFLLFFIFHNFTSSLFFIFLQKNRPHVDLLFSIYSIEYSI